MSEGRVAAVFLLTAWMAVGCGGESPPTYVTDLGIQVWVFGKSYAAEQVDAAALEVLGEFQDRYPPERARQTLVGARVSFLDVDEYTLFGQSVAGNVGLDDAWVYVGART